MQSFKDRLKELREESGLSMKELGNEIGVSDAAICKWENGVAEPKVTYILRLADFFDCSTDFILGRNDDYSFSESAELTEARKDYLQPQDKGFKQLDKDVFSYAREELSQKTKKSAK